MSLGVSSHTTDMTTVSFCTEPSIITCIMLYSVHECALCKSMACRRAQHEARSPERAPCADLASTEDRPLTLVPKAYAPRQTARTRCRETTWYAASATLRLPWTWASSRSGPEETTVTDASRVLRWQSDAEPRGVLCAERYGCSAVAASPCQPASARGTPGTPTSAVSMWLPSGPKPKRSAPLCTKGRGVLIEGRLQWRRWTQAGQPHFTREVIVERIQCLPPRPQADIFAGAASGSAPQGHVTREGARPDAFGRP